MEWKLSDSKSSPEKILKQIVNNTLFGIMALKSVRDQDHNIVDFEWIFANKVASEIVEYTPNELKGTRLLKMLPGSLETGLFERYKKVVELDSTERFEQNYQADKIDKWFHISASKLGDGLIITFQDISDQKKTQAKLETESKKYRKLFQESIDPAFLLNEKLYFINVNSSFLQLFGFENSKVTDISIKKIFVSDNDMTYFQERLEKGQKIDEFEAILLTSSMNIKQCLINCVPIFNEEKDQVNFLGVIRDLTRRKEAERNILMAEKLSMTGKIARTMAHEIRNPLTNLTLALGQLKDEIPDYVEDADLYMTIIDRNASRIGKLIDDLLNSSKPISLNLVRQPVNQVIIEAIEMIKDRLVLQNITLVEDYPPEDKILPLDKDQFKVMLVNLFINAIEAMKDNNGILRVIMRTNDDQLELIIEDNGKGIPEKDLERLFEPFFTNKKDGSGLGLTAVQSIIQSHRGMINVESQIGKGTTIRLQFQMDNVE